MIYRFLPLALFIIFILNAFISHAQNLPSEQIWGIQGTPDSTFYMMYAEDGKYHVDKIVTPENKLQQVLENHLFSTEVSALKFIERQKNISSVSKEILNFSSLQSEDTNQAIWVAKNEWNWEWEQKYSDWIKENFDRNFFVKYQIKTDCADVAISLRWIFSRINSLPAAQSLMLTDRIFSNESMKTEWESLPTNEEWNKDERFLAALNYVLQNTYTHSLYKDSYPIQISTESLMPGAHFLILRNEDGHTLFVSEIDSEKGIYTLCSTTPAAVRRLMGGNINEGQPRYFDTAQYGGGGFLKMRWAQKTSSGFELVPRDKMPYYSLEQYADDFMKNGHSFSKEVHNRLGLNLTAKDYYNDFVSKLSNSLEQRISIVNEGSVFCATHDCSEGSLNYDAYSTPSRDQHILEYFKSIEDLVHNSPWWQPSIPWDWETQKKTIILTIGNKTLNLGQIEQLWVDKKYSSNPNDSIEARWGIL